MDSNKDATEDLGSSHCSTALLPCPFCGCKDVDPKFWKNGEVDVGPGCSNCGATTETNELWNTRRVVGLSNWLDAEIAKCGEGTVWRHREGVLRQCRTQMEKLLDGLGQ